MREPSWLPDGEPGPPLEENWLFQLYCKRYRSRRSGLTHDFYVIHLADAVNVVALTPDRRVILVEQFRAGSGRDSLETPGGLLDPGEDPLEAAARELLEETGYAGDPPQLLGTVWSNPSIMTARLSTVLITGARRIAEPKLDRGEEVAVELVPARRIPALIASGRISHALAVQGLMHWMIAELPGTPLSIGLGRFQVRLGTVMALIALWSLVLGLLANLGVRTSLLLSFAIAYPLAAAIVFGVLDPPPTAVLLRSARFSLQRMVLRLLALVGLFTLIGLAASLALAMLG
ncbi:MAG: NUDIX hydrolase [Isosphaeraceae bacterium]|nr:NUDIX hydrolase [Isosphaeraceae bacterium]